MLCNWLKRLVGPARFELATSCTPSKRASQAAPRPELSIVHVIPANPEPLAFPITRVHRPCVLSPRRPSRTPPEPHPSAPGAPASGRRGNTPGSSPDSLPSMREIHAPPLRDRRRSDTPSPTRTAGSCLPAFAKPSPSTSLSGSCSCLVLLYLRNVLPLF